MKHRLTVVLTALLTITNPAFSQGVPKHYLSAVSTNATNVFGRRAIVSAILGTNTNATASYLKIYDKATAPVCGTDTPVLTIPLAQNVPNGIHGADMQFANGVGFCLTGAIADNDATNATTGAAIDFVLSGR